MRDPKGIGGRSGEARPDTSDASKSRGLDVRFASGTDVAVSRRLKEMYDGIVSEPVPDRFLDLLSQLEQVGKPSETAESSEGSDAPEGSSVARGSESEK